MRFSGKITVKSKFVILYLIFVATAVSLAFPAQAQEVQKTQADAATTQTHQEQNAKSSHPTQVSLPEIPPTPRSKLEIIQYILLPFAIGGSVWLIFRLEKMEREKTKENS